MQNNEDRSLTYLLVDDDRTYAKIMKKNANQSGITVDTVASLKGLIGMEDISNYDLVIVDYDLEDCTGFEVVEYLNSNYEALEIILVSGTNRPIQEDSQDLKNISGFISKWSDPEDFFDQVYTITEKSKAA